MFADLPVLTPHVKSGRLRALAVAGFDRTPMFPDVPALKELGFPRFNARQWYALFAPAGTPREIGMRLNEQIRQGVAAPDLRDRLTEIGADIFVLSPEEFAVFFEKRDRTLARHRQEVRHRAGAVTRESSIVVSPSAIVDLPAGRAGPAELSGTRSGCRIYSQDDPVFRRKSNSSSETTARSSSRSATTSRSCRRCWFRKRGARSRAPRAGTRSSGAVSPASTISARGCPSFGRAAARRAPSRCCRALAGGTGDSGIAARKSSSVIQRSNRSLLRARLDRRPAGHAADRRARAAHAGGHEA